MGTREAKTEQLAYLVQSLPQELYDWIYNLTFTAGREYVKISKAYRPPSTLAVNRATRMTVAASYYSTTTFCVETRRHLAPWLLSFSSTHLSCLRKIRFEDNLYTTAEVEREAAEVLRMLKDVGLGRVTKHVDTQQLCLFHDQFEWLPLGKANFGSVYGDADCLRELAAISE